MEKLSNDEIQDISYNARRLSSVVLRELVEIADDESVKRLEYELSLREGRGELPK